MISLVDIYATATESIDADDYDYNMQGSGSWEYSTIMPEREMTESDIEKQTTTSGLCFKIS
jgi:hypothetical protein